VKKTQKEKCESGKLLSCQKALDCPKNRIKETAHTSDVFGMYAQTYVHTAKYNQEEERFDFILRFFSELSRFSDKE